MKRWLADHAGILILVVAALTTRVATVIHPAEVVWDERHYGSMSGHYLHGKYYFDVHPPLGKLLLYAPLKLAGADPGSFDFQCAAPYPKDYPYVALRILPVLAGSLLPLLIFLLARSLGMAKGTAFLAGGLVLVDTAILAKSHFGMIDIFVHLFGLTAVLFYLLHSREKPHSPRWWGWLAGAAACAGASISVKWTGAAALGLIGLFSLIEAFRSRDFKTMLIRGAVVAVLAPAIYVATFAAHFALLPRTGSGDAFMSARFKAGLEGTTEAMQREVQPPGFWSKFGELNKVMWNVNMTQMLPHGEASRFFRWPLGSGRIWFWGSIAPDLRAVYLVPNPVVWYFGTFSVLAALLYPWVRRAQWKAWKEVDPAWRQKRFAMIFLLTAFFANWLPFAAIARSTFIYHYFTPLMVSVLLGALFWHEILPAAERHWAPPEGWKPGRLALVYLAVALAFFVFLSPITYGYVPKFQAPLKFYLGLP